MYQPIYNEHNQVIAYIRDEGRNKRLYDTSNHLLGRYEVSLNTTFDASGNIVGKGDMLAFLIQA